MDMTHREYVSSLGVVTRLELGLIPWFGESVPDPNENWDASRRWREVERRIARLRWVSDEESKEFTGIKGILNRIMGPEEAEREGRENGDVISGVASYLGLGGGPPALRSG